MPVGKVFNAAENQVLFSPVSNYYKGKAIRQQLAAGEQDAELRGLQIDLAKDELASAPAKRKAAEEKIRQDRELADLQIAEQHRKGEGAELQRRADVFGPVVADAAKMIQDGKIQEGLDFANKELPLAAAELGEDVVAEMLEFKGEDGIWQPEELMRLQNRLEAHYDFVERETGKPSTHINYLMPDGTTKSARPDSKEADALVAAGGIVAGAKSLAEGSTAKERLTDDLERMLGGDRDTAIKIAHGIIEMKQNPSTGMIELFDKATRRAWEIPIENTEAPTVAPSEGKTLWSLKGFATGPSSTLQAAYNYPASWLGLPVSHKVTQARQTFRTTSQSFIRALSINPRFPVGEQERIREEISQLPAIIDSPELMGDRMRALDSDLRVRMRQAEADGSNTGLPKKTRESQKSNANEIKNFLAIMGVPSANDEAPSFVQGEDRSLWPHLSEEDRRALYPEQY